MAINETIDSSGLKYKDDPIKHKVTMIVTESGVVDFDIEGAETLPIGRMDRYLRRASRYLRAQQANIRFKAKRKHEAGAEARDARVRG